MMAAAAVGVGQGLTMQSVSSCCCCGSLSAQHLSAGCSGVGCVQQGLADQVFVKRKLGCPMRTRCRVWNYGKTPSRGVQELECYLDEQLVWKVGM